MPTLELCSGCDRHVRMDEATCPFCGTARSAGSAKVPDAAARLRGLGRAGRMAVATSAIVGIAGCASGSGSTANTDTGTTSTATTTTTETAPTTTATTPPGDDGSIPRPYGAPPARKPRFV